MRFEEVFAVGETMGLGETFDSVFLSIAGGKRGNVTIRNGGVNL